jgi:hypothetical protein
MDLDTQHQWGVSVVDDMLIFPYIQVSAGKERTPEKGEPSFSLTAAEIFYPILLNVFQCISTPNTNGVCLW